MTRWLAAVITATTTIALLGGCKRETGAATSASTQPGGATLNVYIWSEYLPDTVVKRFTDKTGVKVVIDTYDKNEDIYEKLKSGVADYDIVVPSDYMVRTLVKENLIQPIDKTKLPHMSNLDPKMLDQSFDPGNAHSVPYLWGLTGLAYNKTKVQGTVDSWDVLFDEKNKNQICMLDDTRECFAIALKRMGKSLNETDPATLQQAADALKAQKSLVKAFDSGDFANKLASGDVWISHGFTGQLAKVAREDKEHRFVVLMPKEGGTVYVDNMCIPSASKRAETALKFIDFVMEPENAAEISNGTSYASPNLAAHKFIKPELLNDATVYPPDDVLKRCEFIRDLGDTTTVYDRLWTELKGG